MVTARFTYNTHTIHYKPFMVTSHPLTYHMVSNNRQMLRKSTAKRLTSFTGDDLRMAGEAWFNFCLSWVKKLNISDDVIKAWITDRGDDLDAQELTKLRVSFRLYDV